MNGAGSTRHVAKSPVGNVFLEACTLTGSKVRLEPLARTHIPMLARFAYEPDLWRWTTSKITDLQDLEDYVEKALAERKAGTALPFATVDIASGEIVGCTRYGNADALNRRVEIGWTFVSPPFQRTRVNTEAKYLMLRHAFEAWQCVRVEWKTDALNAKSRAAILRLGAKEEGILRNHMIVTGGRVRDTVYYSVTDREWPAVSDLLLAKLK